MSKSAVTCLERASYRFLSLSALVLATAGALFAGDALAASTEQLSVSAQARPRAEEHPSILSAALSAMSDHAKAVDNSAVTLTFEGLKDQEAVLNFYAGGSGDSGSGPGPNYGVTFSSNAYTFINASVGGTGNTANEPSPPTSMTFLSGSAATMTVSGGFTTGFSFYYSTPFQPGSITVYDGPNATGNILATLSLPLTPLGPDPAAQYGVWVPIGVQFSGTARSVDFAGTENLIGFDNITLNSSTPGGSFVLPPPKILSKTVSGEPTTKNSTHAALSSNGSAVVFESQETDLVATNHQIANGRDIYRVVNGQTVLEDKDASGNQLIGTSSLPAVSADGGIVAFLHSQGTAPAEQAKVALTGQMFGGASGQPKHQVDMGMGGATPNGSVSGAPSVAAKNGSNKLVFCSAASNLVAGDSNGQRDIFLVDPLNASQPTQRISVDNSGAQLAGDSCEPKLSVDGTKVVFTISAATVYGTSARQVVRKDLTTGAVDLLTPSATHLGKGANADSSEPSINADGSVVAFTSAASDLDNLGAPVGGSEAFVSLAQQSSDGAPRALKRVRSGDGTVPNGSSQHPQVSNDGTIVVMQTIATNFFGGKALPAAACGAVAITTNFFTPTLMGSSLCTGQSSNQNPTISGDGTMVGFDSNAPQSGTSSSNSNAYSQAAGASPVGVPNLSGDFSGQWFDPNQSGQGLVIDVIHPDANNNRAMLLTWFVFVNGKSTWLQGVGIPKSGSGAQAGSVIVPMDQVAIFQGKSFPLGESHATGALWGSITLTFANANTGTMNWTSTYPGFNSGSMAITHFLPVDLPSQDLSTAKVRACYSGNWSNPAQSGHGFEFEVIQATPPVLAVDWFAFSPTGAPVWLQGAGPINGNSAQMQMQLIDGAGAQFPPLYNPALITQHLWGTATITFTDSSHATVTWNSTIPGYGSGTQPLQPILGAGLLDRRTCP